MDKIRVLKALQKGLQKGLAQAIYKLDDETKEWVAGIPEQPWQDSAVKNILDMEKKIVNFFNQAKKHYLNILSQPKSQVKKQSLKETPEKLLIQQILEKLKSEDEELATLDMLEKLIEEFGKACIEKAMEDAAKDILADLDPDSKFTLMSKEAKGWLENKVIQFARNVTQTTHDTVISILIKGFEDGKGIEAMATELQEHYIFSRDRAKMIARTEVISSSNAGTLEAYRQSEVVVGKEWTSANDSRTRPTHRAANGQKRRINEVFSVGSSELMHPGDTSQGAEVEEIIACRCTTYPVLKGESLKSNTVYDSPDYGNANWLKEQDKGFVESYLGSKNKRLLFETGALKENDFHTPWSELKLKVENGIIVLRQQARENILDSKQKLKINVKKQNRHIPGTREYIDGKSILSVDAQELINQYAGTGDILISSSGKLINRERVSAKEVIGIYKSEDGKIELETKNFTIHYSKNGPHIIPARP